MSDIFISYSKQDRIRARDVAARLMQEGWSVFWDRTIPVGKTWDEVLEKELNTARVIVVLWSNDSVSSEWVRAEAAEAANRKILVPAALELITIPIRFRFLQTADISDWKSGEPDTEGMRLLIEAIVSIGNLKLRQEAETMKMAEGEATHKQSEADAKKKAEEEMARQEAEEKRKAEDEDARKKDLEKELIEETAQRISDKETGEKDDIKTQAKGLYEQEPVRKKMSLSRILLFLCIAVAVLIAIIYIGAHQSYRGPSAIPATEIDPENQDINNPSPESNNPPVENNNPPPESTGPVTDINGNIHRTVTIGTQVWMAENLKTTRFNDGTAIPLVTDITEWINVTTPAYCWQFNDETNKSTYGALYNGYTPCIADNGDKNVCPTGWHVPTDADWTTLIDYLGGENVAGGKLKEASTTHWHSPNTGATNESGFTALPGGFRGSDIGDYSNWWSSDEYSSTSVWSRDVGFNSNGVRRGISDKKYGLSIRCIKD